MEELNKENYNILYVDDEKRSLNAFKLLFRRKFNIFTACSGEEGLELLATQPIHIIITDQRMPKMKGIEFLKTVKATLPDSKFIILTAYNDTKIMKEAINEIGVFWYVNKPFDPQQMEQVIINAENTYLAEKKLKESEEKFRGVFNSISDVFTRSDMDGKCLLVSPSIYNLTGYKPEELVGRSLSDFYADPNQRIKIVEKLKKSKNVETFEFDIIRKDGKSIVVSTNAKLYYNNKGEPLGVEGVFRDITEQKKIEEKLRNNESSLKEAQDLSRIGSWSWEVEKNIVVWSDTMYDLVGWDKEKPPPNFEENRHVFNSESYELLGKAVGRALEFSEPYELDLMMIHRDGHSLNSMVRGKAVTDSSGKVIKLYGTVQDITDRKRAESEHDKLFNNSFDLLCISGFDGYFKELNPAWEKTMGYTLDELYAKPYREFIHPDDREMTVSETEELSVDKKETIGFENRYLTKSGQIIYLSWSAIPVPEENLVYSIARNITKQKNSADKILVYRDRLKSLANELILAEEKQRREIANDLHDDVGQILASLRLQIAAIKETMGIKDILKKLNYISSGLREAIDSTRNVIFELSPPQLNELGLASALSGWMHKEMTQYNIKYEFSGDTSKLPVNNEIRYLLYRCIRELLYNVIKHAGATNVIVSFERKKNIISISVHDNGSGFSYNHHLTRTKDTGFGLLSINERIESIDGELLIDKAPGKGTNATLRVPIKKVKI